MSSRFDELCTFLLKTHEVRNQFGSFVGSSIVTVFALEEPRLGSTRNR